ncbi:TIGR04219 family outer membrane beta-barrel protein [Thalassotalea maritima]|uniref:TIGR04219 family outer membrane beta-barrel protein n=1 Tax=Thalassotalea maritima TaxID=3242416 RepID=UPI003527A805
MKKTAALLGSMMMLTSLNANADVIGVYAGAQLWDMSAEGSYADSSMQTEYDFESEKQNRLYIEVEHPVPLIPNVKIAHSELMTAGFEFGFDAMLIDGELNGEVDVTYTDYTLYYELFDNGLFSFDFGLTAKDFGGDFVTSNGDSLNVDTYIPMLYLSAEVALPLTGLDVFAEGNILAIGDNTLADYQAGVAYALVDNMIVDVDVQLGYRVVEVELDDVDDIYADLKFDGVFAGLEVHF